MRTNLPCLPLIQERFWNAIKEDLTKENKKYYPEFEMTMFLQTWGSTALGFGGIGGQAMTSAYTTVVRDVCSGWCGVFFGEKLAYKIKDPNQTFNEDVCKFQMKPVYQMGAYIRKEFEEDSFPMVEVVEEKSTDDNDICEWEVDFAIDSEKYKIESACGYTFYDTHHAVPYKNCPYCRRKIKVKE